MGRQEWKNLDFWGILYDGWFFPQYGCSPGERGGGCRGPDRTVRDRVVGRWSGQEPGLVLGGGAKEIHRFWLCGNGSLAGQKPRGGPKVCCRLSPGNGLRCGKSPGKGRDSCQASKEGP